jgi:hypothetical protein
MLNALGSDAGTGRVPERVALLGRPIGCVVLSWPPLPNKRLPSPGDGCLPLADAGRDGRAEWCNGAPAENGRSFEMSIETSPWESRSPLMEMETLENSMLVSGEDLLRAG